MKWGIVAKTIGLLLMIFSFTQLPPVVVDILYQQQQYQPFLWAFLLTFISGFLMWLPARRSEQDFRIREGILVVVSFWLVLSLFAATPFILTEALSLSFHDAFFESMSGLTTTGATVLSGLDELPKGILYYRQQLQWLGGMGIIVLAVAVLPILGVGGMALFHAEASGISRERLTPKLAHTAKVLWLIYIVFTLICLLGYYLAGMDLFDAIGHSYATVAIGGFSTHDASIGYFNSPTIELIAMVFMVLAGANFSLHFMAWQAKSPRHYWADSEFRAYFFLLTLIAFITVAVLLSFDYYTNTPTAIRHGVFQAISMMSTTGFASDNFFNWPLLLPTFLIFASFIGASAGSTGGGIKVVRILLMFKLAMKEVKNLIHPSAQINIKLNQRTISEDILVSVWGFFALYVITFVAVFTALMFTGLDQVSAFSATTASLNNLGPGLGDVAQNYGQINNIAKWILSLSMLLGRLEILTLIALLHKAFWRF